MKVHQADNFRHSTALIFHPPTPASLGLFFSDEIVKLREYRAANPNAGPPQFNDPGFRALVEENAKNTVRSITKDPIITDVSNSYFSLDHFHSASSKNDFLGPCLFVSR